MEDKRATKEELAVIHGAFATWCVETLKGVPLVVDGVPVMEDGRIVRVPPSPALMSVIRQYLKDNKIEAGNKKLMGLGDLSDLPTFDDSDTPPTHYN